MLEEKDKEREGVTLLCKDYEAMPLSNHRVAIPLLSVRGFLMGSVT